MGLVHLSTFFNLALYLMQSICDTLVPGSYNLELWTVSLFYLYAIGYVVVLGWKPL